MRSKNHLPITFSGTPQIRDAINRAVVRRTVERGSAVTQSAVICEALEQVLLATGDDDEKIA